MLICFDESFPSVAVYFEHAAKFCKVPNLSDIDSLNVSLNYFFFIIITSFKNE